MSNISSIYNSVTRMSGLSGLDVEGMVTSLMMIERAKVNKVSQSRQTLLWKQEKYRNITSALQNLNNEYFNSLKPATDMRNSSIYNAFAMKYDGQDTSAYFSAVAGSGAKSGDYTIKNIQTALTAKVTGSAAAGDITGNSLTTAGINAISSSADNNKIAVTFNGTRKEITIKDNPADLADLVNDLQSKLDTAFGSGKITVGTDVDKLTFATSNTNTLSFSSTTNGGYAQIFNTDLSSGLVPVTGFNKFNITLGTETKEFELPAGNTYADADAVAAAIQGLVDDGTNGFGAGKINVKNVDGKIVLESVDTGTTVSASAAESSGLAAIGMKDVNTSNKIDLTAKLYDIRNSFALPLTVTGEANDISFEINGQTFNFDSRTTSLNDIMVSVNSNVDANVKLSYDSTNNKFLLETKQTGVTARLNTSETSGGLLGSLSLIASNVEGRDASIIFNDGVNGDQLVSRSTNTIIISGITFNLQKDGVDPVNLSVSSDPTKAVELIKGFVNKYNEVLDKINDELSQKREYSYEPLTDDQKDAMSEDEIKQWEEKAKSGLLAGDNVLRSIAANMRNALLQSVEGTGVSLASIGIKSSSWTDKGKLYVDEEKLKSALNDNPDAVFSLFTKQSDVSYIESVNDPTTRTERMEESGLIYRLSDILEDNIRTITLGGHRGALLEKAGMPGDRSQFSNTLYDQISDYDDRISKLNDELILKENSYYAQFAQLETLINSMNTQSTWLSQQFG